MAITFYNSLTRREETFSPLTEGAPVGVYACGPTVYSDVTIGNWRTYFLTDAVVRILRAGGYSDHFITNITDVGHLTGDNLGDADTGEDRLEKAAREHQETARDIANRYFERFKEERRLLNLIDPNEFTRAADDIYIKAQKQLIETLYKNEYVYLTSDGLYFDVAKYESKYSDYSVLSGARAEASHVARIDENPEKKDYRDFALWKFSPNDVQREMEWESPLKEELNIVKKGFPGWHLECSAMSMKHLGEQFDIHIGGEDLRQTHHPNEIAQSQAATGKTPFVKYWLHSAFLLVDGGKMGKSLGNAYTLTDIQERGIDPMALRYLFSQTHYRKQLNFTWEALRAAETALHRLYAHVAELYSTVGDSRHSVEAGSDSYGYFIDAVCGDVNISAGLAELSILLGYSDTQMGAAQKLKTVLKMDEVLGFNIKERMKTFLPIPLDDLPDDICDSIHKRATARAEKRWSDADALRDDLAVRGYSVSDTNEGQEVRRRVDNTMA